MKSCLLSALFFFKPIQLKWMVMESLKLVDAYINNAASHKYLLTIKEFSSDSIYPTHPYSNYKFFLKIGL